MPSRRIPVICHGHSRPVCYVEHSESYDDNFYIASGCFDGEAHIRAGKTGDWIGTFSGHKGAVWSAKFNKSASLLVTASADYSAKLWDAVTGAEKATFPHQRMVKDAIFSPSDDRVISGGFEKLVRVWDVNRPEQPLQEMAKQESVIKHVSWNRLYGDLIITASGDDNILRCYDLRTSEIVSTFQVKGKNKMEPITSMKLSKDSAFIVVTTASRVIFYNARKMLPLLEFEMKAPATTAALHPTGDRFVVGSTDFAVRMYGMDGTLQQTLHGHHGPVHWVSYAPDGRTFASGSDDGTVRLWQNEIEEYGLWTLPTAETSAAESS